MKRALVIMVFAALIGSLYGQSVVELSKQEKARREKLGAKRAKVVTNADLAAVRKTPAVIVVNTEAPGETNPPGAAATDTSGVAPAGGAEDSGPVVMTPRVVKDGPALFADGSSPLSPSSSADVASRLKAAEDLIDLLTTKMNSLLQQANNLDTMTPKDVLQRQIDETNQKLIRVQDEAAKLKAQLEAGKQSQAEKR